MQFTIPAELRELDDEDEADIDRLMHTQCSARRFAFNRLTEGMRLQPIIQILQDMFSLNWRYCEHAARDAEAQIQSQHELLPLYIDDLG